MLNTAGGISYLDLLMVGGIGIIAYYLWSSSRKSKTPATTIVDLKHIKSHTNVVGLDANGAESSSDRKVANGVMSDENSLAAKMRASGKTIAIFFGSQTGTAEEYARRLAKTARMYGLKAQVIDPEEIEINDIEGLSELENGLAVFILATYGEGDPTDNAQVLFDQLHQDEWDLKGLNYAVFGLGNKTYKYFNQIGKYFDKRLTELNGTRLVPLGLGDDDAHIEQDFVSWMETFWANVCEHYDISTSQLENINTREYRMLMHGDEVPVENVFKGEMFQLNSYTRQKGPYDSKNPFLAPITVKRNLFKDTDRKCLHIELDITGSSLRYETGDHVAVYPANDALKVNRIGELLGIDLDTVFTLVNVEDDAAKKHPFPCPTTFRTALTYYLDIAALPKIQLIKELAQYATDESERKKLQLISSPNDEGKKSYNTFVSDCQMDLVTLLERMSSLKPPIDHLIELLPRLQARYYSISSSPKCHPNSIHITCTVIEYQTKDERTFKGVATNWLWDKPVLEDQPSRVPIFVRKSQFRLPFKFQAPIIMIGPGTGFAPFRGFIQERDYFRKEGRSMGKTILYYGCRNKDKDFLYPEELAEYESNGTLTQLNVAFSRDQEEKRYVTHLLRNDASLVWEVIKQGGYIYVCGDAKHMANDVNEILIDIAEKEGAMSKTDAKQFIENLGKKSRYLQDVWS